MAVMKGFRLYLLPTQFPAALKEFEVAGSREDDALALSLTTLPVVDYTRPSSQSAVCIRGVPSA